MSVRPISFRGSYIKTLTAAEVNAIVSNQHELHGVAQLRPIFGDDRVTVSATFSIRGRPERCTAGLTWYDAREANLQRSAEYRLYFQSNPVMNAAREGDNILIGVNSNGEIHCELIPQGVRGYVASFSWSVMIN